MKTLTSFVRAFVEEKYEMTEEKQDFLKNSSTIDAIHIIRQLIENAKEFN